MVRRGQTIVAERERTESESERLKMRQKETLRKRTTAAIFVAAVTAVILLIVMLAQFIWGRHKEAMDESEVETYAPTVQIVDERGDGYAEKSDRLRNYIGQLEKDFSDAGYKLVKVVLPAEKLREVDAYIEGRGEYYKCHLDRGTAETVEDATRMMRYLDGQGIKPGYVDVRLEGKAYYL